MWAELLRLALDEAVAAGSTLEVNRHAYHEPMPAVQSDAPLLVVGHSFGGSAAVDFCRTLARPVDHLLLLDPVPVRGWGVLNFTAFVLPDNVRTAACYRRRRVFGVPPFSHPIRQAACPFQNHVAGLDHDGIVRRREVQTHLRDVVRRLAVTTPSAPAG